ncbi:MAG: trimethylamine methyltransferase family protein [Kiritimatiellae bacterium]|nr:trimethylamine methyltransferase family protein [Kiritimatiellia bacterium]
MNHLLKTQRNLLPRDTLDQMHQAAVRILHQTGIAVQHEAVAKAIAGRPGFELREGRVCISPEKVEAVRQTFPPSIVKTDDYHAETPVRYTCGVGSLPFYIVDRDGATVRPFTRADVIDGCKLVSVLNRERGLLGVTTGTAADVPIALQPIEHFMITARYSPAGGVPGQWYDIPTAEILLEMQRVYSRPFKGSIWSPSPLILGGSGLDILWHFRAQAQSISVASMPMMGMTAPCGLVAAYTQGVAECLGGAAILHELLPQLPITIHPRALPADPRTGAMVMGTPEWDLFDVMHRDVHNYYGFEREAKVLHTMASVPNAQAAAEHGASAMLGMLYGCRVFGTLGQLAIDEVFSPVMLMVDLDILDHTARIASGAFPAEGLGFEEIPGVVDEVINGKLIFAEHISTVTNFRSQYLRPELFQRLGRSAWVQAGRPDILKDAQARIDALTAEYEYEPPPEIIAELERIYERSKKTLGLAA